MLIFSLAAGAESRLAIVRSVFTILLRCNLQCFFFADGKIPGNAPFTKLGHSGYHTVIFALAMLVSCN